MFTRIAERLGILDVLAPRSEIKDSTKDAPIDCNGGSPTLPPQEALDETIARKFQAEEDVRYKKIRAQYEAERQAERLGSFSFAKKQRVLYHHKAAGKTHPAVVVAVHYDDGPNKPYYTIKYKKLEKIEDENGSTSEQMINIEKQTTPDRLTRVPWDEEATWEIIG